MRYDLIAGLSVAGLLLPESVAYASIAGLSPQHGVVAAIIGLIAYAAIGRSRYAMVTPTSSSAAIIAAAIATFAQRAPAIDREAIAAGAVCLAGLFFLVAGVLQLGRLSSFISRPVLRGFAFGLSVTIVARQFATMLALEGVSGNPFHVAAELARNWRSWNMASLAIGLAALAGLIALRRYRALPGPFIVLVAGIALSHALDLSAYGVRLAGVIELFPVQAGVPNLSWREWTQLAEVAAPLFLIIFAESWGSMRSLALRHGDDIGSNRELLALGVANLLAGLARGMPVGAGFSASVAAEAAGARTRLSGPVAGLAVLALVVAAAPLIARLPQPVLAAIVVAALLDALNPAPLLHLWRINRDQYVALIAALGVMLSGVVDGILLAVALSIVAILQRMANPRIVELGRLKDGHDFIEASQPDACVDPRIVVLRPTEPLFFANAEFVFTELAARLKADGAARAVILSLEETSDIDSTALEGLIECDRQIAASGRRLYLARVKQSVADVLMAADAQDLAQRAALHFSVADAWATADAWIAEEAAHDRKTGREE
ncbi:MAG: SulP family inorganic anion transporter [Rhodoblastus sp.]